MQCKVTLNDKVFMDGGIDERPREEGFLPAFPLLTSYLRQDRSHAGARLGWPGVPPERRPVGTPVRWERAEHREGRAAI
jgi:hypothetical protein